MAQDKKRKEQLDKLGLSVEKLNQDGTPLPNFKKVSYNRIFGDLQAEYDSQQGGYDTAKTRREQWHSEYLFSKYKNENKMSSSYVDSSIFNLIEWMLPSLIKPFVEGNEVADFIPEGEEDVLPAAIIRELLTNQLKKRESYYELHHDTLKGSLINAHGYGKVTWFTPEESGERYGRPKVKPVHPDSMRWDWSAPSFYDSRTHTYEEDMMRADIISLYAEEDGLIRDKFSMVLNGDGSEWDTPRLRDERLDTRNAIGEETRTPTQAKGKYLVRESWTSYDMYGDGSLVPILVIFIDDVLVLVRENPYDHGRSPFVFAESIRDPFNSGSISLAGALSDIQKYKTGIMRLFSDNMNSQQNGMYEVDRVNADDIVFELLKLKAPNTALPVRKMGSIAPIAPVPVAGQAFNILELAEVAGENRGGFTRFSQGLNSDSLNQTATGFVGTTQRSELRMWEIAARYSETFFKPMLRLCISLDQQFMTKRDLKVQFGPLAGKFVEIKKDDISGAFMSVDIDLKVGSESQQRVNNYNQYLASAAPFIGQGVPPEVISVTMVELAKEIGLKSVEFAMRKGNDYVGSRGISIPKSFVGVEEDDSESPSGVAGGANAQSSEGLPNASQEGGSGAGIAEALSSLVGGGAGPQG